MAREDRKRKQSIDDADEDVDRRGRRDKRPKEERSAPPLPSEIRNKEKRNEVYAKLKSERKAQKRKLGRERVQAANRAAELGKQAWRQHALPAKGDLGRRAINERGVFIEDRRVGGLVKAEIDMNTLGVGESTVDRSVPSSIHPLPSIYTDVVGISSITGSSDERNQPSAFAPCGPRPQAPIGWVSSSIQVCV